MLIHSFSAAFVLLPTFLTSFVYAQPSPQVQKRISAAIAAASNQSGTPDYTAFVNPFIGTGTWQVLRISTWKFHFLFPKPILETYGMLTFLAQWW
jgi:hypothetical protein